MELNQLQCFLEVAQEGSVTRAAEKMYITQSALSRVIQRLETELGVPLFKREHKKLVLNENGKIFQFYISRAIKDIAMGVTAAGANAGAETQPFRIRNELVTDLLGAIYDVCQAEYVRLNLQFCRYYKDTEAEFEVNDPPDILITSCKGAMGTVPVVKFIERWCVIAERKKAAQLGDVVTLERLSQEPIVFWGSDADLNFIRDVFMRQGLSPQLLVVDSVDRSAELVNKGLAIACVPESLYHRYDLLSIGNTPFFLIGVEECSFERDIFLCKSRSFIETEDRAGIFKRIQEYLEKVLGEGEILS